MSWRDRAFVLLALLFAIVAATVITGRQDSQGQVQRDLGQAQVKIKETALAAKRVADQLAAFQFGQSVSRVEASDQRCENVRLQVQVLDMSKAPPRLSHGLRENYRDCIEIRARYLGELTPAQLAEYHRRTEETK